MIIGCLLNQLNIPNGLLYVKNQILDICTIQSIERLLSDTKPVISFTKKSNDMRNNNIS